MDVHCERNRLEEGNWKFDFGNVKMNFVLDYPMEMGIK